MAFAAGGLSACNSTRTVVLDPAPPSTAEFTSVELKRERFINSVTNEDAGAFERWVLDDFEGLQTEGGRKLQVEYRILCVSSDDPLGHWFNAGGEGGEDVVTVEVVFRDDTRKELARIQTLGYIKGGLFGGGLEDTLEESADEVAEYVLANFLAPKR